MSLLSDGLQYISFELLADTEAGLAAPNVFLSDWNEAVRLLTDLTGRVPGSHAARPASKLTIREVADNDPEVSDGQVAVWSPVQGVIKLNRGYKDRFLLAANTAPMVLELAEALGTAATAYQAQTPTDPKAAHVLGRGELLRGLQRAVGMYPLAKAGQVSSVWSSPRQIPFDQALNRELVRAYRKLRMGYMGDDYLGTSGQSYPDADIAYGLFLELFIAFGTWADAGAFLKTVVPTMQAGTGVYTRTALQEYDDLITQLSLVLKGDIRAVLQTWKFSRVDTLNLLPEGYRRLGSTQAIVLSERMRAVIDPQLAAREDLSSNLPGFTLGGADAFALEQSSGPVLVLLDPAPQDGISYKGLKAALFGTFESNGLPKKVELVYDLGEMGSFPCTLIVPVGKTDTWDLKSNVVLEAGVDQELWYGKLISLGEPKVPYKVKIPRWVSGVEVLEELEIPVETYAVIAKQASGYTYVDVGGSQAAQVITRESNPLDKWKDALTQEVHDNPSGKASITRAVMTFLNPNGTTTRSFATVTDILDGNDQLLAQLVSTVPATTDPVFFTTRERPLSEGRARADLLGAVGHPVLTEQAGFGMRVLGANLAEAAEVSVQLTGFQTEEKVAAYLKATVPQDPVKIIDVPYSFVSELSRLSNPDNILGATEAERELYKLKQVAQAINNLPEPVRQAITAGTRGSVPVVIPQLYQFKWYAVPRLAYTAPLEGYVGDGEPPQAPQVQNNTTTPEPDLTQIVQTMIAMGSTPVANAPDQVWEEYRKQVAAQTEDLRVSLLKSNQDVLSQMASEAREHDAGAFNQIRNFLNGNSGRTPNGNDPNNPLTYLSGSFTDHAIDAFQLGKTAGSVEVLGMLNLSGNPRATAGILSGLLAGLSASAGLEALSPGLSATIEKTVEKNLVEVATQDKPPLTATVEIVQDLANGVLDNIFKDDRANREVAGRVVDFLAGLAKDYADGKLVGHDVHDMMRVTIVGSDRQTSYDLKPRVSDNASNYEKYIPLMLGLSDAEFVLESDPRLTAIRRSVYGEYPLFENGVPRLKLLDTPDDLDFWSKMFGKNLVSVMNGTAAERERQQKVTEHIQRLRQDAANAASLQNYRAALVQDMVTHRATARFDSLARAAARAAAKEETLTDEFGKRIDPIQLEAIASAKRTVLGMSSYTVGGDTDTARYELDPDTPVPHYLVTGSKPFTMDLVNEYLTPKTATTLDNASPVERLELMKMAFAVDPVVASAFQAYYTRRNRLDELVAHYKQVQNPITVHSSIFLNSDSANKDLELAERIREANKMPQEDPKMTAVARISSPTASYTFEVMPAVKSSVPTQGMQAPGADRGIAFRTSLNIAKLNVPGSTPVYQVMGVNEETLEFVGAFLGMRSALDMVQGPGKETSQFEDIPDFNTRDLGSLYGTTRQYFRAQQESEKVRALQLEGSLLTLTLSSYHGNPTKDNQHGLNVVVKGYIVHLQRSFQRDDRVWYQIMFRITDHQLLNNPESPGPAAIPTAKKEPDKDKDQDQTTGLRAELLLGRRETPSVGLGVTATNRVGKGLEELLKGLPRTSGSSLGLKPFGLPLPPPPAPVELPKPVRMDPLSPTKPTIPGTGLS